jgi:hypothetical protein
VIGESNYPILITPYPITPCPKFTKLIYIERVGGGGRKKTAPLLSAARGGAFIYHRVSELSSLLTPRFSGRTRYRASPLRYTHTHTHAYTRACARAHTHAHARTHSRPNLPSIAPVVPYQNAAFVPFALVLAALATRASSATGRAVGRGGGGKVA